MLWRVRASFAGRPCGQDVVGNRSGAGADAEESIERRMACAAAIETEHELVQVVLKVCPSQAVVNAQAPALEV